MVEIKSSGKSKLESLKVFINTLDKTEGKVGWFGDKYEDGTPVAYVAAIQEYGSGKTPPRSFMRSTVAEKKDEWENIAIQLSRQAIAGKASPTDVMGKITLQAEADVSQKIATLTDPPLSPVTLELRAMKKANPHLIVTAKTVGEAAARVRKPGYVTPSVSTKPLIDTGYMIATLTSQVNKK